MTGVLLASCHDKFRGPRSDYVRQVASETTTDYDPDSFNGQVLIPYAYSAKIREFQTACQLAKVVSLYYYGMTDVMSRSRPRPNTIHNHSTHLVERQPSLVPICA
ncbi:hypothetical protein TNCV_3330711 [Trichonephila clavipes]|nr:hypothetical protein TNCV_3330711 [Trichonephila clavipes]